MQKVVVFLHVEVVIRPKGSGMMLKRSEQLCKQRIE